MSMRTHIRAMAHEKAKRRGVRKMNKIRFDPSTGRRVPSWFAENWERAAAMDISDGKKQKETKAVKAERRRKRAAA